MKHQWQGRPWLRGSVCSRCGLTLEWVDGPKGLVRRLTAAPEDLRVREYPEVANV